MFSVHQGSYLVYSVAYEAIYFNMPEFGLARATERMPPSAGGRPYVAASYREELG